MREKATIMVNDKQERNKAAVREYFRSKKQRDRESFEELFHEDFSTTFVRYHGGEEKFDAEYLYELTGDSASSVFS